MANGVPLLEAPRWINLVALVLGVLALAWTARRAGGARTAVPATLAYGVMFFPVMVAAFTWSESMYIALSLGALGFLGSGIARQRSFPWPLAAAGALAGAAMLTRYIGFTLIGAGLAAVWLLTMHQPPRLLRRNLLCFAAPAIVPNAYWLVRNRIQTGFFFGEARPDAWFDWDRVLRDTGQSLTLDWVAPIARHHGLGAVAFALAGALGALVLCALLLRRVDTVRIRISPRGSGMTFLLWTYAVTFVLFMILLSRRVGFDPINTRYLSPIYPVLLILGVQGFRAVLESDRRQRLSVPGRVLLAGGLVLLAAPQLASTWILIGQAGREERTVTTPYWTSTQWDDPQWAQDPGLARLRTLAGPDGVVISNLWDLVGIRTGLSTKALPETGWDGYPGRLWGFPGAVIAVHRGLRSYRATVDDLRRLQADTRGVVYLEDVGEWSFFRVVGGKRT
jgi:4-amino-4-deoxy-L-arabinose transferase-like glycosyltransferase